LIGSKQIQIDVSLREETSDQKEKRKKMHNIYDLTQVQTGTSCLMEQFLAKFSRCVTTTPSGLPHLTPDLEHTYPCDANLLCNSSYNYSRLSIVISKFRCIIEKVRSKKEKGKKRSSGC
jgi:hypothetical protein